MKFGVDFQTTQDWTNQLFNGNGGYAYTNLLTFAKDFTRQHHRREELHQLHPAVRQSDQEPAHHATSTSTRRTPGRSRRRSPSATACATKRRWLPQPTITNPDWPQTGSIPAAEQEFRAARQPVLLAGRPHRDPRRLRHLLCAHPRQHAGYPVPGQRQVSDRHQRQPHRRPARRCSPTSCASAGSLPGGTISLQFADPKSFRTPYTQQGTLAIEHQFTRDIAVTASYIWSRGIGLFTQRDLNLGSPVGPYTYTIQDAAGNNVGSLHHAGLRFQPPPGSRATARSCRWKTAASPGTTLSRCRWRSASRTA